MLSTTKMKSSERVSIDDTLRNFKISKIFNLQTQNHVTGSNDSEPTSLDSDKIHRRNPLAVRQETRPLDDIFLSETTLADLQLSEMPGLHNTEQWKRIATRIGQKSPPLSRQYYQTAVSVTGAQDGQVSQVLASYRRPGRTESEQETSLAPLSKLKSKRRQIIISLFIFAILVMIVVAIVVAVILVRKPKDPTTDYYSGSIVVRARFDPALLSTSSTLAKNYEREFCTLISTTLSDRKTKYAIFYSTCSVYNYRNGSIIGDFTLGFTRYQNVTRLNAFLDRTIVNGQLFGGTVTSIMFNSTTGINTNATDYDTDYDQQTSLSSNALAQY
ncbi:unnamed protein product [Adineta ricciae]|uniref:SEA domain-containing protein n=1 Tax=Adineta ricciae TaxID=249248 RepID=A0A814LZR9_ADIRI|nr:unnamed protein product [Adineta ricciae]CAF1070664.1 unnamed protein product [Adineta ricciae]